MSDFSDLKLSNLSSLQDLARTGGGGDDLLSRLFSTGFRALLNGGSGFVGDAADLLNGGGDIGDLLGGGNAFENQLALIRLQAQLQDELQRTSLLSNVTKSRHEARMAAVRNMKP